MERFISREGLAKLQAAIGQKKIKIVAATKTVPANLINELPSLDIHAAGENRVQELEEKFPYVSGIEWHFIGRLQTNKVKYIVDKVKMIHSVDRRELVDEIEKRCAARSIIMDVLIEINAEPSKGGVLPAGIDALADYISDCPHLRLKGLMCVPAIGAPHSYYAMLHRLHLSLKSKCSNAEYLSVGMSDDYLMAIENGANLIRPGRLLFGQRT